MSDRVDAIFSGEPIPPPPNPARVQLLIRLSFPCALLGPVLFLSPLALGFSLLSWRLSKKAVQSAEHGAYPLIPEARIHRLLIWSRYALGFSTLSVLLHIWLMRQSFYRRQIDSLLSLFL